MEAYSAVGRRKRSIARVYLKPGKGDYNINGRSLMDYFKRPILKLIIEEPFLQTETLKKFDIKANIVIRAQPKITFPLPRWGRGQVRGCQIHRCLVGVKP